MKKFHSGLSEGVYFEDFFFRFTYCASFFLVFLFSFFLRWFFYLQFEEKKIKTAVETFQASWLSHIHFSAGTYPLGYVTAGITRRVVVMDNSSNVAQAVLSFQLRGFQHLLLLLWFCWMTCNNGNSVNLQLGFNAVLKYRHSFVPKLQMEMQIMWLWKAFTPFS